MRETCRNAHVWVFSHANLLTHIHACACIHTCARIHAHTRTYVDIHMCQTRARLCGCVHARMCVRVCGCAHVRHTTKVHACALYYADVRICVKYSCANRNLNQNFLNLYKYYSVCIFRFHAYARTWHLARMSNFFFNFEYARMLKV